MKQTLKKAIPVFLSMLLILALILTLVSFFLRLRGKQLVLFGYRVLYVISDSMEPAVHVGDYILIRDTDPSQVRVGDIISFISEDPEIYRQINTHRVTAIADTDGKKVFTTRGDNSYADDDYPVFSENLIGVMLCRLPFLGWVAGFFRTAVGYICLVVLPIGWLAVSQIREILTRRNKKDPVAEIIRAAGRDPEDRELYTLVSRYGADILQTLNNRKPPEQ